MAQQKLISWFLTEAGKKFSFYAAGTATTGVLLATFLPHTLLLSQYKDIVQLYRKGLSVPLDKKLHERFEKALDLLQIEERDKHLYEPFSAYGFDVFSAGSAYSRFGVVIGLPANFAYDSVEKVETSLIKVKGDPIIWDSESGELLQKSLVLSENAQLYAIAREIKYRQTAKVPLDVFFATMACITGYAFGNHINNRFNFYSKPFPLRFVMYCLVGAFIGGNYIVCKDVSQVVYEEQIDKELIEKNPIFAQGGKEFYSKILQRNIALRKLLGKEGEKLYTVLGNENFLLRHKHIPIVQRKIFFEESLPA